MTRQVQIEGPLVASLYRIFEEKQSDLLLKIFGSKTVWENTETTDKSGSDFTEKVSLVPESWKLVNISDVLDWETGQLDVDSLSLQPSNSTTADLKPCLGFLRFRQGDKTTFD